MSFKSSLSYLGVASPTPANTVVENRAPTSRDFNFNLGDYWLHVVSVNPASSNLYVLVSKPQNQAVWTVIASGSGPVTQFDANSGSATPSSGVINDLGSHGINTVASGNTITTAIDNAITLGDLSAIPANNDALTITTGDISLTEGKVNLPVTTVNGGSINIGGSRFLHSYGSSNTFVGDIAGNTSFLTTAANCVGVGELALSELTTGIDNVAVGSGSMSSVSTGSNNIALGTDSGGAYFTESNNIAIGNLGVFSDSGVIRIGTNGTQTSAYIVGIEGVDVGNVAKVVTINADQLGSATLTAGSNITITPTANTITIASSGGGSPTVFDADSGTATPAGGIVNLLGSHGINTAASGNTLTTAIDNAITLGDLSAIPANSNALTLTTGDIGITAGKIKLPTTTADAGSIFVNGNRFMHAYGTNNAFLGTTSGNFTLTGANNVAMGLNTMSSTTSGAFNVAIGSMVLPSLTTGLSNIGIGGYACSSLTTGNNHIGIGVNSLSSFTDTGQGNVGLGSETLNQLLTGSFNVAIGYVAGLNLTTNESSNILINSTGVVADNNTLRIGSATGTSTTELNKAFICGIEGVNVGSVASVVTINADQLGSATLTAGTNITITPSANTITISAAADLDYNYTTVNASPYVVLSTDQFISVNLTTIGGAATVQLPDAPATGRTFTIKDKVGLAATSNITVTTVSGAVTIDGATTFVMNTNYQAINVIFGSAGYEVY